MKQLFETKFQKFILEDIQSNEYDKLIGDIISRSVDMKEFVTKTGDRRALELFKKYQSHLMAFNDYMAYEEPTYTPGFEGTMDALDSLSIREDEKPSEDQLSKMKDLLEDIIDKFEVGDAKDVVEKAIELNPELEVYESYLFALAEPLI
tara:strand:+ start:1036 stop:1482 length:447 start_codon:yes stop_codon:yes gene_type:complete